MGFEKFDVEISDLGLDLENPRTGTVTNQPEALEAVIRLNIQHFKNMMKSIRTHGLDPGDSFYIINDEDQLDYVVVDGN